MKIWFFNLMVKRDYLVRCRRCRHPYNPEDISRVRTCVFCRKSMDAHTREKKLQIMVKIIKRYFNSSKNFPNKDLVFKWATLKFDVRSSTVNSYFNEMINNKLIEIYDDGFNERVRILD